MDDQDDAHIVMAKAEAIGAPPVGSSETRRIVAGNAALVAGTFCWASAFPATVILLQSWHPLIVALARIGGAAIFLSLVLLVLGRWHELRYGPWRAMLRYGGIGVGGAAIFIVWGQALSDPVTAAIIATTTPLISAIMGRIEGVERLRAATLIGIALAIIGGSLASIASIQANGGFRGGEILIVLSQTLWVWFSRRSTANVKDIGDVTKAAMAMACGSLLVLLVILLTGGSGLGEFHFATTPDAVLLAVWIATCGIGFSVTLWLRGSRLLGVTFAAMHVNLGPFYVMLLMLAVGGAISLAQLAGAGLVACGAIVAQTAAYRRRRGDVRAAPAGGPIAGPPPAGGAH